MMERTVYLGVVTTDELYLVGPKERQVSVPWCILHDSRMQTTICESYDLQSRRIGRNPFAGKSQCDVGVVWKVAE